MDTTSEDRGLTPAEQATVEAMACEERGDVGEAERLYGEAIRLAPEWSIPSYNLGLLYKRQRRWRESLEANRRATVLDPGDEAAWWNLGIAATALADWSTARAAWKGFGLPIPEGEGPLDLDFGLTPIRLDPEGAAEVVWCERIDPARAIIRSIPLPASCRRFGDLLLHDGEPRGTRQFRGHEVPVFHEIELLEASLYKTYSVVVEAEDRSAIEELSDRAFDLGLAAEDWSTIRMLCRACSEGRPHQHTQDVVSNEVEEERTVGIAASTDDEARSLLTDWSAAGAGRSWSDLRIEFG
jgi:hypothetical protein